MDLETLLKVNKEQIREDDSRKEQSLAQFREWLSKHPFIVKCRTDESWLLGFLRTKKYSMDDAFKSFENHHLFRMGRPEWFEISEEKLKLFREVGADKGAYVLRKRNTDGSFILVINLGKYDFEKFGTDTSFNIIYAMLLAYFEIEENQILGCTLVFNYANVPLKFFASFSLKDVADFAGSTNKGSGRFKKFILVALPTAAQAIFNASKMAVSEKQRERILLVKDNEELAQHIDKSILTETLGGEEDENVVYEEFFKVIESKLDLLKSSNDFEIDLQKARACRDIEESVGSFRTLQID